MSLLWPTLSLAQTSPNPERMDSKTSDRHSYSNRKNAADLKQWSGPPSGGIGLSFILIDVTTVYADLATFSDNKALRSGPRVEIETTPLVPGGIDAARIALQDIDGTFISDEPVLVLPDNANRGADLVSYSGETVSEIDRR